MLGQLLRADNDADLRQGATGRGIIECVEPRVRVALITQGRAVSSRLVLFKVGEHVVFEVVKVLPDLPRDTGILEVFGKGLPYKGKAVDFRLFAA